MVSHGVRKTILAGLAVVGLGAAVAAQPPLGWWRGFEVAGLEQPVFSSAVFDDGSGSALYLGAMAASGSGALMRLDASGFVSLGSLGAPHTARVKALAVFDDGSGPALYVGGSGFAGSLLWKWNGSSWSMPGPPITVFS